MSARRSSSRAVHRVFSLALAGMAFVSPRAGFAQTPPAAAPAPASPVTSGAGAKALVAAGDKAAKAKDWAGAEAQYKAALAAQPSAPALEGLAGAQYELKNSGESYESYDRLLKDYGATLPAAAKKRAEARLKELAAVTGYVSIRVNESGADVNLDGKLLGTSPVAALVRVTAGPHKVDVSKAGFAPVSKTPNVGPNGKEIVEVTLAREATTGHLVVKEKSGQPVRVLVDGADVGAAPLDVEVAPGPHDVSLRSATLGSPPQHVEVTKGGSTPVELAAVAASAHLDVTTADRKGIIFLDGKPVAEGAYSADVAVGPHTFSVTREGYEPYEKSVSLADKQVMAETVSLKVREVAAAPDSRIRSMDGIYGGLALMGLFAPGGEGNELDTSCSRLGASSCSTSAPAGGGLALWLGWAWHPMGVELFVAGEADQATPSATFLGAASPLQNPLSVGNPHVEQFGFVRFGGLGAVRARISVENRLVRASLAAGVGVAAKFMQFERKTKSNSGGENVYTEDSGHSYVSPALSIDGSVSYRLSGTMALALGLQLMLETAGDGPASSANGSQYIAGGNANPSPLTTPSYHLASGAQTFLGPYLGLQFGP
ncbi:MAG TPA: PEGA domain-containing protein [Polyangiaceae bacterium]